MIQEAAAVKVQVVIKVKVVIHPQEEEPQDVLVQEEEHPIHQVGSKEAVLPRAIPHHSRQEEQGFQAVLHSHLQGYHSLIAIQTPWVPLDRSRKSLPKLMLPSNYRSCSILDMRQLLESWYDKSTFAIATWRGDAQRYWLTQVLDCARNRHDQWLHSTPSQRASLEPAYILGDRKHIPEAQNAVESVLRTELLDVTPKSIADACMRHGYCTAELIVWYVMKQLILPHDINEVTMQKEILTHPKVAPSTLDQGCAWLEEMQHRLNLCTKTGQQVHPRTIITFVQEVLSGITQCYRTVGNTWDSLYLKHQLRESNLTLERVYAMLAEFLIELRLHEEQDKIAQIVTGASSTVKHSMYEDYVNASKGRVPAKGKGKQGDGKGAKSKETGMRRLLEARRLLARP